MELNFYNRHDSLGNAIGYATHQKNIYNALKEQGIIFSKNAKTVLHITPTWCYTYQPNKVNILYTMYEYTTLPPNWRNALKQPIDLIIVPCQQNKELFSKYTKVPIEICLEGVDTDYFKFIERIKPEDRPFTFLWSAANNLRKGWLGVLWAWNSWIKKYPETQLILKTLPNTKYSPEYTNYYKEHNILIDCRKLPLFSKNGLPALLDIYSYANAFLMPSMGEGFCLPLVEALATGLPCVYTNFGGPADYMSENIGYPAKHIMAEIKTTEVLENKYPVECYSTAPWATIPSIISQMENIYLNYGEALQKGKLGADMVRKKLTWKKSASNLIKIIRKFLKGGNNNGST